MHIPTAEKNTLSSPISYPFQPFVPVYLPFVDKVLKPTFHFCKLKPVQAFMAVEKEMMNLLSRIVKRALLGFLLGTAIGNLIAWLSSSYVSAVLINRTGNIPAAIIVQSLVCGLYGSAAMAGTIFYDIEQWPLTCSSIAHYLVIAVLYVPAAAFLGWADNAADILIFEGILLAAYFVVWLVMYLRYKSKVRILNEELKRNLNQHH